MPHAALWVVQRTRELSVPYSLDVSMPHAALWVVQPVVTWISASLTLFQCRTRLCGWCSPEDVAETAILMLVSMPHAALWVVQQKVDIDIEGSAKVSMPHAALWVVQLRRSQLLSP